MERILDVLIEKYRPQAVIVYGSFADGSNGPDSDFDALLIAEIASPLHDTSAIDGTALDVFVYPPATFQGPFDPEEFIQVFDGRILLDSGGMAAALKDAANRWLNAQPKKSPEELRAGVDWCEKMLRRARRGDAEGFFRWHWVLADSLEIYMDLCGRRFLGPKKALRDMSARDPASFAVYQRALEEFTLPALEAWIGRLKGKASG